MRLPLEAHSPVPEWAQGIARGNCHVLAKAQRPWGEYSLKGFFSDCLCWAVWGLALMWFWCWLWFCPKQITQGNMSRRNMSIQISFPEEDFLASCHSTPLEWSLCPLHVVSVNIAAITCQRYFWPAQPCASSSIYNFFTVCVERSSCC